MKPRIAGLSLAALAAAGLGLAATAQKAGGASGVDVAIKAENFRLVDQDSYSHELSYYRYAPAIVLIAHTNGSAHLRAAADEIRALQATFATSSAREGVKFFFLNSSLTDDRAGARAQLKALGLDIPVLMDDMQLVGESLGVTREAQALVIEPKTMRVVYSGPIDDRFSGRAPKSSAKAGKRYLADALDAVLAGRQPAQAAVKIDTPQIAFPERARKDAFAKISYAQEIAPILQKNCVACHSEGGIAPFAMNSYEAVKAFAPMMRESIRTDRMPPYNADPHVGPALKDAMNLSAADAKTLVHWIEAGAPRDAGADPLKISAKPAPEWELGEPDVVITLPPYAIPASGVVDYQNPVLKSPLTEGRWLRASTINVGDRKAVHHLLSPVGGYAVGAESTVYPEGTGVWAEPGANMHFQLHYTPYGKETTDVTRVGLYFYPKNKGPDLIRRSAVVLNASIEIPPHAERHQETAYITFPKEALLYSVFPHAHYRGESVHVSIQRAGEAEEMILSLPKYDFNWQRPYEFAEPLRIPAGTRLITRYQYDNSKHNAANPDPAIRVKWGEQSWEEMQYTAFGFGWADETVANPKPDYMAPLLQSRVFGMLDSNVDGKIMRDEVRGLAGERLRAGFDRLDADGNGYLDEREMEPVARVVGVQLTAAESEGIARSE